MISRSYVVSTVYLVGLWLVFLGERVMGAGQARTVLTAFGVAAVLVALIARGVRLSRATDERKKIEQALLALFGVGVLALVLYFVQSDLWAKIASKPLDQSAPKLAGALGALWPVLITASILPVIMGEMAYASMSRAPAVEGARVRDAIFSGLGLTGALVFAFAVAYVAYGHDTKWDLSYFRTARPGEATRKIVRTLDEPVEVSLFFPPANEVRDEAREYFTDLAKESKDFDLQDYDQAVDVAKAKELGVTGNGAIVVSRKGRKEQMVIGLDLEGARSQLQKLDQDFQKKLLEVVKAKRTIYLVSGHGERSEEHASPTDQRGTIKAMTDLLKAQNYDVKPLSAAEGLASDVPKDAAAVLMLGPQSAPLPEEIESLDRYLDRGGRLFLALDPESGLDLDALTSHLGVKFVPTVLANDQVYLRRRNAPSDRTVLVTASYTSHPALTTLSRLGDHAPIAVIGAGYVEEHKDRPKDLTVDFTIRSHPQSWNDLNGNNQFDPPQEIRKAWNLEAAVTGRKPNTKPEDQLRAIVLADSDALTDGIIENPGNAYLALDGVKWLLGEESIAGEVSNEEDRPIEHTRKQDVFWFYSTIFLVPALVLGAGVVVTRRRGKRAARPSGGGQS